MGSWPALGEVAQKARKDPEKENKPQRAEGGTGGEEGEGVKPTGREKKGGGNVSGGGGGGERKVSVGGGGTVGGGGGGRGGGGGVTERGVDPEANGDSQKLSGRRKGIHNSQIVETFNL